MPKALRLLCLLIAVACSPTTVVTHGVPNLSQVEANLWRSGQITTQEGWQWVYSLGVRHDVKLNFASEGSDDGATAVGITVHTCSIEPNENLLHTVKPPDATQILEALRVIRAGGGVLVHCTHNWDRTGLVIGEHRVLDDHWTPSDAYKEMLRLGFHEQLIGLHHAWDDFVHEYERNARSKTSSLLLQRNTWHSANQVLFGGDEQAHQRAVVFDIDTARKSAAWPGLALGKSSVEHPLVGEALQ